MKFCYEKKEACCCVPISNATCAYLFHLTIHGGVVGIYVFTTYSEPPLHFIDYFFAGTALSLSGLSFFTMFFIKMKVCQCWRAFLAFLLFLGINCNIVTTVWYSVERWNAEMKTMMIKGVRPQYTAADPFWYFWLVLCWVVAFLSIYYEICILSCLCNPYNAYLFTSEYASPFDEQLPDTTLEISRYSDRYRDYKPYPVQKLQ